MHYLIVSTIAVLLLKLMDNHFVPVLLNNIPLEGLKFATLDQNNAFHFSSSIWIRILRT